MGRFRMLARLVSLRRPAFAVAGAAAALCAISLAPGVGYTIGPGEIRIQARPARHGTTVIALPPLGTVEAHTHAAPLRITLAPASIDVPDVERLFARRPDARALVAGLERDRNRALKRFGLRTLATGALGGILAFALLRGRRPGEAVAAVAAGAIAPIALYAGALMGFDPTAFREPTLTGALIRAPGLIGPIEQLGQRLEAFRKQLDAVGSTAFRIYSFLAEESIVPADAIRILHISDLHLNPVGFDVALQVARQFGVEAVVDTGDITAEGTDLESGFVRRIADFAVPYLFVRGNHDAPVTEGTVRLQPNAIVLDGGEVRLAGLTFFGIGDPIFTPRAGLSTAEQREAKERFAPTAARTLSALDNPPDVALVHDRAIARDLPGRVPLVLAGHDHRPSQREERGTRTLVVGSTGAAGLHTFTPESGEPIAMQILFFDRSTRRLVAYDRIEVRGPRQEFFLKRTAVGPSAAPVPTPSG